MKKIYTLIYASALVLLTISANATTHHVNVGQVNGGTTGALAFNPNNFTASVGDTVVWVWFNGFHSVDNLIIPGGAATFSSPNLSSAGQTFTYPITTAGSYTYQCGIHTTSMTGAFSVTGALGISAPSVNLFTSAYPNPCSDKMNFTYNGIDKIEFYNVIGEQIKAIELENKEGTIEMNFDGMVSGIYFYRTYKNGLAFETRKIVKKN